MCAAADLEFLADDPHVLVRFQEDVWRVTELCNKAIGESEILEMPATCCHARHTHGPIGSDFGFNGTEIGFKKTPSANVITLYDVDGKGLGRPFHTVDPCRADVVGREAGLEAADQDATVAVNRVVHSRRYRGAIVHP